MSMDIRKRKIKLRADENLHILDSKITRGKKKRSNYIENPW